MSIEYPSRIFLSEAAKAIHAHVFFEISVCGGWRGRMLAKEVKRWLPFDEPELLAKGWRGPSPLCSLLMVKLHGIYYTALSANYEMRCDLKGHNVTLSFLPLGSSSSKKAPEQPENAAYVRLPDSA